MSNSSDPDQNRHFVGPDLNLNCLQKLSAGYQQTALVGRELTIVHIDTGQMHHHSEMVPYVTMIRLLSLAIARVGSHVVFAWIHCTDVRIHCTGILIECR